MQGDPSVSNVTWPCYFLLGRRLASYQRITLRLLGYLHCQGQWAQWSGALLAPHVSSPCLDANEEIDIRVTGSPGCLSLQLCQTNQMRNGEPSMLLVGKGYRKADGANT